MGFGKANLDNTFEGFKYFKLRTPDPKKGEEQTELVVRLLPAMHSYEDSGEWKFFYGQHYGYFGVNSRNPDKPRSRPFGCIQKKNKQKEIVVRCPKCDQIEKVRAKYDKREEEVLRAAGVEDKKSREAYEAKRGDDLLKRLGEWLSNHNCDKKFWINVMSLNGEFGVLQLSYTTCMDKLVPYLKRLRDQDGIDAFDPNGGVWLRFTRTGTKPRVTDDVETYDEVVEVGGRKAKMPKAAPMTSEQIEKALKICPDLKKDVVKFIDAETMERLVKCSGDPEEVDRIWPPEQPKGGGDGLKTTGLSKAAGKTTKAAEEELDEPLIDDEPPVTTKPAQKTAPVTQKQASPETDEEAELERLLAKRKARQEAERQAATQPQQPAQGGSDTDDPVQSFLKQFSA